ncbi:MAG: radical SAM protein [Xanthobacteraceae bacterium]|nr:radical SAM protein [Xanthobacteraceae bacterium]
MTDKPGKYTPDQPKVPGADVIYRPAGEAGEYAPLATNPYKGCNHACKYCYVPLATHQDRAEFNRGAVPRAGYHERLLKDCARYQRAGVTAQVMLSFATDVYGPRDASLTRKTLIALSDHGLSFCVLTKGGTRALQDADLYRSNRDAFAVTLTTLAPAFSKKWEPGAPLPDDRVDALRRFHARGIFTWVSLEPTLDVEASLEIVRATHGFVDLYKIGRANYLKEITRTTDWRDYTLRMIDLCQQLGALHYIKRSLQEHLPPNYPNPLRVQQHH